MKIKEKINPQNKGHRAMVRLAQGTLVAVKTIGGVGVYKVSEAALHDSSFAYGAIAGCLGASLIIPALGIKWLEALLDD